MPIGNRQIIILTYLAINKSEEFSTNRLLTKFESWATATKKKVVRGLAARGWIEDQNPDSNTHAWKLTIKGWQILDQVKWSPVKVLVWDDSGWPLEITIRRSTRKGFEILYEGEDE